MLKFSNLTTFYGPRFFKTQDDAQPSIQDWNDNVAKTLATTCPKLGCVSPSRGKNMQDIVFSPNPHFEHLVRYITIKGDIVWRQQKSYVTDWLARDDPTVINTGVKEGIVISQISNPW